MRTFLSLALLIILAACSNTSEETNAYLLTNLNVIDLESGEVKARQSVLIEGDTISSVFKDGTRNPSANKTISMEGKYILPGLWDMHIHLRGGGELKSSNRELLPLYLAHGVTSIRDAGGDLTPAIFNWRNEIKSGDLPGPYIYTSGPKIDGPNPTWEGSIEVETKEQITAALDSLESIGVDYVKIYESRLTGEAYLEIIRQAKERGLTVTGHMPMEASIDEAIAAGLDGIEHLYYVLKGTSAREQEIAEAVQNGEIGFWEAVGELKDSFNEDTALVFYQKLADNEVYVVPTLHIDDILSYLHQENHSEDEFLRYIPEDLQQTYQRRVQSAQNRSPEMIEFEDELNALFKKITYDMHHAGVKLLAGSDAGAYNSFVYPGLSLHKELEAFTQTGLSPLDALRASSVNGAKFLGEYEKSGSVEPGKKADLLILDENPLDDIRNTRKIHAVISNGNVWNRDALSGLLSN